MIELLRKTTKAVILLALAMRRMDLLEDAGFKVDSNRHHGFYVTWDDSLPIEIVNTVEMTVGVSLPDQPPKKQP